MQKAWWFLVVLGVLVAFHELGHFLAARWVGVKVLKFSLGFGPKIFGRQIGETEYLFSAIPLGATSSSSEKTNRKRLLPRIERRSFAHQSLWGKVLIVAAGPGFNFILAYLIFAAWLATGIRCRCRRSRISAPSSGSGGARIPGRKGRPEGGRPNHSSQRTRHCDQRRTARRHRQRKGHTAHAGPYAGRADSNPDRDADQRRLDRPIRQRRQCYYLGIEEMPPVVTAVIPGSRRRQPASGGRSGRHIDGHAHLYLVTDDEPGERKPSENRSSSTSCATAHRVSLSVTPVGRKHDGERPAGEDRQNWHFGTRPFAYAIHDSPRPRSITAWKPPGSGRN